MISNAYHETLLHLRRLYFDAFSRHNQLLFIQQTELQQQFRP